MKHKSDPILEVHVQTDPAGTVTLTGRDRTDAACRIYVENNGWFTGCLLGLSCGSGY